MAGDDKIPSYILERIMDKTDQATAKELSNLENAVALLVTNLNTPPRIEDINRLLLELDKYFRENVHKKVETIETTITKLEDRVGSFISKLKWIAGIVTVVVVTAIAVISYVTTITEKTIDANTTLKIKEIEEKYDAGIKTFDKKFEQLLEEIKKNK